MLSNEQEETSPKPLCFVGKRDDIIRARRVVTCVNGRDVLVLYHQGAFHALDARCYHSGGPLQNGDIEEFNGRLCIICPWHKYKITLAEGEGMYEAVDPSVTPLKPVWRSKGVKQRVHSIMELCGDVLVSLDDSPTPVESDRYQTEKHGATLVQGASRDRK